MATVDGLTKDRMLAIEAESITDARLDPVTKHLILTTHGGTDIDVGDVQGDVGPVGPAGAPNPGATVTGPPAFGAAPVVGVNADYSRKDHAHGLPALPPALLGVNHYAPNPPQSRDTNSQVLVAADTGLLTTAPFVAPASGQVLVRMSFISFTNDGTRAFFGLFEHGTSDQVGTTIGTVDPGTPSSITFPYSWSWLVQGLVPGSDHQFDLAFATDAAFVTIGLCGIQGAHAAGIGADGPFIAEVWSA